jgi:hypothetical protein
MDVISPGEGGGGRITKKNGGWKGGGVSEDNYTYCDTIPLLCSEVVRAVTYSQPWLCPDASNPLYIYISLSLSANVREPESKADHYTSICLLTKGFTNILC